MKLKNYLIILLFIFIACDKTTGEPIMADEYLLAGKWKNTEDFISIGGPQFWMDIENGEEIEFFENGTFSSNRFNDCISGNFTLEENELLLKYNCIGFSTEAQNEDGFITFKLEFFSDYFTLTPTSGPICIEGCSSKYQKKK